MTHHTSGCPLRFAVATRASCASHKFGPAQKSWLFEVMPRSVGVMRKIIVSIIHGLFSSLRVIRHGVRMGDDVAVWSLTAEGPRLDIMRRPEDLAEYRRLLRQLYARIKTKHGENATIAVFPALPNSAAIETGRVWMPKADLPLRIYDQNLQAGGFIPTLTIKS